MIVRFTFTAEQQAQIRKVGLSAGTIRVRNVHFRTSDEDVWAKCPIVAQDSTSDFVVLPDGSWLVYPASARCRH